MKRLPPNWFWRSLGEIATVQTGLALGREVNGDAVRLPYLRVANVQDGFLDLREIKHVTIAASEVPRYSLRPGDLLLTEGGDEDKLGRGHIWHGQVPDCIHQNHIFAVRAHVEHMRPEFLAAVCASDYGKSYFRASSKKSTNLASINKTQLSEFPVPTPTLCVQDFILSVLRPVDKAESLLARLIDAKQLLRDGLAAELLTGRRRLMGFTRRPWREVRLGEVTRESTRRNGERLGADRVMAVTKSVGLTPMRVHTMSDSLARYKVLRPGGFAYNPMRLNIGSIARSSFKRDVLVSPDYVVFEAVPEALDPRFLDYTRRAHAWRRFMMTAGSGGVRMRIYFDDLARLRLLLPGKEEQSAIADILDTAFQEIACLTLLRETVGKQKRGLMHGLLSGKIRIKEESHG